MNPVHALLRQTVLAIALLVIPGAAILAQGKPAESQRVALKGHDPVAYFTVGRPVKGAEQFAHEWDGARYLFASAANRDTFAKDPDRYAPQFAGYCTGSMSKGVRNEADPEAWIISDGRLYVFGAMKFKELALKDSRWRTETVALAGEQWRAKR